MPYVTLVEIWLKFCKDILLYCVQQQNISGTNVVQLSSCCYQTPLLVMRIASSYSYEQLYYCIPYMSTFEKENFRGLSTISIM